MGNQYRIQPILEEPFIALLVCLFLTVGLSVQSYGQQETAKLFTNANLQDWGLETSDSDILSRKVSLNFDHVSIEKLLTYLEREVPIQFSYDKELFTGDPRITLQLKDVTLEKALNEIFQNQPINYYALKDGYVVLRHHPFKNPVQQETITGTVTDGQSGETLPGVNILVKGTPTGTSTDSEGNFELTVESLEDTLVVSFIGYQTKEVPIQGRTAIDISLQSEAITGEEMVVIGYGEQERKNLTSSISSVSAEDMEEAGNNVNVGNVLKGKVSGVRVQEVSGQPGSAPVIRMRGVNTLTAGNDPLWVIDGVPISGKNFLKNIDLSNVENIDILKDVAATSIYGSRGSNGVIIVETKKGQAGETKFNVDLSQGWSELGKSVDILSGPENAEFIKVARNNAWLAQGGSLDDPMSKRPFGMQYPEKWNDPNYNVPDYNYDDFVFRTAMLNNMSMSATGGGDFGTFYVGGSYSNEGGIVKRTNFKKYSLRVNTSLDLTDYLSLDVSLSPSRSNTNLPSAAGKGSLVHRTLFSTPRSFSPLAGVPGSGVPEVTEGYFATPTFGNGVPRFLWLEDESIQDQILGGANLTVDILPELSYRISGSYTNVQIEHKQYNPLKLTQIENELPHSFIDKANNEGYIVDQTLTYDDTFNGIHDISLMVGYSNELHEAFSSNISGLNFPNDLVKTFNAAPETQSSTIRSEWSLISYLGRFNYSFDDKYLINFNVRRDGSSRFSEQNKWALFPSVSAAWQIANEDFFQSGIFNRLKLRASYGRSGNDQIGNYNHLASMNLVYAAFGNEEDLSGGYYPSSKGSKNLTWEKLTSINVGMDIGLLDDRISLTVDAYRKLTSDLLMNVGLPEHSGFSSQILNIGKILNKGLEAHVTSRNLSRNKFQWTTDLNLSFNDNEVKSLGPSNNDIIGGSSWGNFALTRVGEPIGSYYLLKQIGVWNTEEEINNNPHWEGAEPGDPRIKDANGDGTVNNDDRVLMGRYMPKYMFGISNKFNYKNFDFSFFINASGGNKLVSGPAMRAMGSSNQSHTAHLGMYRNFWKGPDNPGDPMIPEPNDHITGAQGVFSDRGLFDASYISLKNFSLGYNLPNHITGKLNLSNIKFTIRANNLWIHDNAPYVFNVEGASQNTGNPLAGGGYNYTSYPLSRQIILNLSLSF